jgi:anaerobic selenocysteine-containing dehydrogenase
VGAGPPEAGEIGALVISGDEAVYDPRVLELAGRSRFVLATAMFMGEHTLQAHLVVPGASYLEREGTTVNLEGRRQRQRRVVTPPAGWDELEFFARLAQRFEVAVSPWAELLPAEQAGLEPRTERRPVEPAPSEPPSASPGAGLQLVSYRPLFSGPAVERIEELAFQRPAPEVELAWEDAEARSVVNGDLVTVGSNGSSRELRARVSRKLRAGVVRIPDEHAQGLGRTVEVTKA